ncbi:MAG: Hpt domain-containing protein [Planctomycetota bacterium]|nr:Hpt domain-containing protein [Planctomycetota bacterium]
MSETTNTTNSTFTVPTGGPPVRSQFANEPEMRELVELFVGELPQRTQTLMDAYTAQQWEIVQRISHQLKGASAGYGFPTIGAAAGRVEEVVKSGPISTEETVAQLTESVKQLISLCQRAAV